MESFEHGHHAQAEQIHFDDAHVGAIFFVPLHDDAAGHGGGLQRHDGIELALADHHAAGMLAEMARQILDGRVELEEFADQRVFERKAGFAKLAFGGFLGIVPAPRRNQRRRAAPDRGSSKPSTLPISRAAERPR